MTTIANQVRGLKRMRLPALQARFLEVVGTASRSPNKVFLIRKIKETLEAQAAAAARGGGEGRPSALTVDELRAQYLEVVGRPTGSRHRGYLIWKIREARAGRVTVGALPERVAAGESMVLPVRFPTATVECTAPHS